MLLLEAMNDQLLSFVVIALELVWKVDKHKIEPSGRFSSHSLAQRDIGGRARPTGNVFTVLLCISNTLCIVPGEAYSNECQCIRSSRLSLPHTRS